VNWCYFGLGRVAFAWGEQRSVSAEPMRLLVPYKFIVTTEAHGLLVLSFKIGGVEILAKPGVGVPIELLADVSTFPQVRWPPIGPGLAVVIELQAPPEPPAPPPLRWWRRLWNWITRKPAAKPASPPVFSGSFYGSIS